MASLPELEFTLDEEDYEGSARKLIPMIRPEWEVDKVEIVVPTVGFLNLTLICHHHADQSSFVIKTIREIYSGPVQENLTLYRFLHRARLGPAILALFTNGVIMECVKGESFDWESPRMYDPDVWEKLAEELARWHRRSIYDLAVKEGVRVRLPTHLDLDTNWDKIMQMPLFRDHKDEFPTKQQLKTEFQSLHGEMLAKGQLHPAFLHFDINPANIYITKEEPGIKLIDFDSCGLYYAQYELAWYFRTFKEHTSPTDFVPGRDYEMRFIRHYLTHRFRLDGAESDVTDTDIVKFYREVQKAKLFVTLRSIIFPTFIMAYGDIMHYYLPNVKRMWKEFSDNKARINEEFFSDEQ